MRGVRVDDHGAGRRDPARRLRGSGLARRPARGRGARDRARPGCAGGRGGLRGAFPAGRGGNRARAAGDGVPGCQRRRGRDLGPGVEERVAAGGLAVLLDEVRARRAEIDPLARSAALAMARPGARVDAVEVGVSERQLRRRFVDAVGYGPKTLARVLRFQRFLALANGTPRGRRAGRAGDAARALAAPARGRARRPRVRGRLLRSGAPDPRGAAAVRPHARRARRLRCRARGRARPFRSRTRAPGAYRPA